jgi:hypothetical protein
LFGILLTGVLADVAIWRRSLARDMRDLGSRVTIVETTLKYVFPRQHHKAVDDQEGHP